MAGLRLGPVLRYADTDSATVWVEADRPCTAEVRCPGGEGGGSAPTFSVAGHHYALIPVTGLPEGSDTPYEVHLGGEPVWPPPDSPFPPSTIRTAPRESAGDRPVRVTFGSCRWSSPPSGQDSPVGPDALDALAARIAGDTGADRPDLLLLLGDQVYADETSPQTRSWLASRRDLAEPPGEQVADFEEYTRLYDESWTDPEVRWLLSTVPSLMIFDDHDVIDDWNTSASWLAEMRETPWWQERIVSGLMSYWIYQHLGNLGPAQLATDPLYKAVRSAPDGTEALRSFAARADADRPATRWSYRRDLGRVRLLMVDTRMARVLTEEERAMLHPDEEAWLREQALGDPGGHDHLLIGSSLPWLLPGLVHEAERWNAALCGGERGPRWARFGEWLRRAADLEHWAAFPASFDRLAHLTEEAATAPGGPATVCVLSGDVHHAYAAESRPAGTARTALPAGRGRVHQLTCSPVHNAIPLPIRAGFRLGWSRAGGLLGRVFARHGRTGRAPVTWRRSGGPWFGNQLMTLTLRGRRADLHLDQARTGRGPARLERVWEGRLDG
ncbi:alkaline phosphatase D family protein [Streptomyces sp. NA13]|uniref:alkaline phosphatase D family protein n=1 Tax=Streptomyces sp. NA13 TaxID=2996051 RepID=UPI0022702137|nr:alkaline phosphatase D family protein [Streptomyces sp. NA13]WAC95903.1 alkaline phosphatase D family protein [Streptomyces sp. NA13]